MMLSTKLPLAKKTHTLLITGASSGMGGALIRQLSSFSGVKIRAMVHRSLVNVPGCEVRPGNLNNSGLMARALAGVDTVVHLAALTKSERVSDYFHTNVTGTKNLIDACVEQGVKKILYISSRAASLSGGGYAFSKLEAEECVKNSGLKWVILRPSEVYGQGAGDSINRLIRWIQRYPCVPVIGSGKSRLSPVYIDDVVSTMALAIFDEKLENETIVLAGPEELTYDELVDRIAAYLGVNRLKIHLPAGLVKLAAVGLSKLGIKIVAPDQIPRLLCKKPYELDLTREKLNYSPCYLEEGMEKTLHLKRKQIEAVKGQTVSLPLLADELANSSSTRFDQFSKNYNLFLDKAICITGYDTKTLVDAKLKKLKNLYPSLVKKRFHFLDYGCGIGNLYDSVSIFFPKVVYTGVDSSSKSINEARSRFSGNSNFQELCSSQWKNNKYDLIFSSGVFHHIPHQEHGLLIKHLSNLLNPNGKLVIWEHNPINPFTQKIVKECEFDKDAVLIQSNELKRHFRAASLAKVQIIYTTFFPKFLSSLNIFDSFLGWFPLGGQYLATGEKVNES